MSQTRKHPQFSRDFSSSWEQVKRHITYILMVSLKSLYFVSLLNKTSTGSFIYSLFVLVPVTVLFNSHRKPCVAGFWVLVDLCRQIRKRMANSSLLEMPGPANARLISRTESAGRFDDSAGCAGSADATQCHSSSISKSSPVCDWILSLVQLPLTCRKMLDGRSWPRTQTLNSRDYTPSVLVLKSLFTPLEVRGCVKKFRQNIDIHW